jgi:hypothetical protein
MMNYSGIEAKANPYTVGAEVAEASFSSSETYYGMIDATEAKQLPEIGEFLPRTSAPTFAVRLFAFLFAVALYILWILVGLMLAEQRFLTDRAAVLTALFRLFMLSVPDG